MDGFSCPLPPGDYPNILLAHGGGGSLMQSLLSGLVLPTVGGPALGQTDAAVCEVGGARLAFTTDSFVVQPLAFAGGDIGRLAVCGTVNDLAMVGATPLFLSLSLILEEGLPMAVLQRVLESVRATADAAGVAIVTGDTKVVDRGKGDGIFINTAGIGLVKSGLEIGPARVRAGDAVIVSGDVGRHGIAVMAAREGIAFETGIESDVACLHRSVARLVDAGIDVHCLRDLTRGGLVSALAEIAEAAGAGVALGESAVPVAPAVHAACELLGIDPFYVANEGRYLAIVPAEQADAAVALMREETVSAGAVRVGVVRAGPPLIVLETIVGVARVLDRLSGEQLPRIC